MNKEREQQMMTAAEAYAESVGYKDENDLCATLNVFCAGWRAADSHPNWIPVEERLPEFVYPIGAEIKNTSEYVLVYNGYSMYISRLVGGKIKWWEDNSTLTPTHWMEIVPPQRKEAKNEQD